MEVGFVAGAVRKSWVRRKTSSWRCGGFGRTAGRDGVGERATGSSKEQMKLHSYDVLVQKGNAVEERKIQRLFRNPEVHWLIKKNQMILEWVEFPLQLAKLLIHWKLTSMFYL